MKKYITFIHILLICVFAKAQEGYWQQQVDVRIDVTLNDVDHTLDGYISIDYTNNSPDTLDFIYMHLWPNAYNSKSSAYAKQALRTGNSKFHFASIKQMGHLSNLNFKRDDVALDLEIDKANGDIAKLILNKPLPPGDSMSIHSTMFLKIPHNFSRLGHVGQTYQITQWYPKPAVYDAKGWHPMPYLNMGEFYSEFGNYEVSITLPANYVVGATGALQTPSEIDFLRKKSLASTELLKKDIPKIADPTPSSDIMKTITYRAENVHDFAWFANKQFYVQKGSVKLENGQNIGTWVMFSTLQAEWWKKGLDYVNRAVEFYSRHVGPYPYPHATAVESALGAGGGMEYPMITVIGATGSPQSLDQVITHEVGHNWFYGVLGFNERDHVWLDEGINSYYDHRYTEKYYKKVEMRVMPDFMLGNTDYSLLQMIYLYQARRDMDQAPATHSNHYSNINYFLSGYEKPAVSFKLLEKYLGTKEFDVIMKGFYEKWKFKHPQPLDLRSYVETHTNKEVAWFFDGLMGTDDNVDYCMVDIKHTDEYEVTVRNKGDINTPFALSGLKDGQIVKTKWFDGFAGEKILSFPSGEYDLVVIDEQKLAPEIYRHNNTIKTNGWLRKFEPLSFPFLLGTEHSKKSSIMWTPALAWNNYDKTMIGLALYNSTLITKPFEFSVLPMFGTASKTITGIGHYQFNILPKLKSIRLIEAGTQFKRFSNDRNFDHDYRLAYNKIKPYCTFHLETDRAYTFNHSISVFANLVFFEDAEFSQTDPVGDYIGNTMEFTRQVTMKYEGSLKSAIHPLAYEATVSNQEFNFFNKKNNHTSFTTSMDQAITYAEGKNIDVRFFLGLFLSTNDRASGAVYPDILPLAQEGHNDYVYEDFYFGRSDQYGIWSQQINMRYGGFKTALGSPYAQAIGKSNNYIVSVNLKADLPASLPLNLPIKPYFDLGYFKRPALDGANIGFEDQLMWQGGFALEFLDGALGIYFPIVQSKNLNDLYKGRTNKSYLGRISFLIDLNRLSPYSWRNNLGF